MDWELAHAVAVRGLTTVAAFLGAVALANFSYAGPSGVDASALPMYGSGLVVIFWGWLDGQQWALRRIAGVWAASGAAIACGVGVFYGLIGSESALTVPLLIIFVAVLVVPLIMLTALLGATLAKWIKAGAEWHTSLWRLIGILLLPSALTLIPALAHGLGSLIS
jgi:hypothetical protein